ncbi:putative hydrolase [Ralstonia phage RSP15]|uniref:endolysin n=1 Tax=Ralstonia phage RSP15 TaxID=1785960 RepID=UPI00074D297E|nr:endolysin [Ralstonia phage RSP15]BAU40091.1 putative hydrolase [Ralstonia phage RSP15]
MTEAIIWEAGTESYAGKTAVANVIMNRTKSSKFPDSVCSVVRQKGQFDYHAIKRKSWPSMTPALEKQISDSVEIAIKATSGSLNDNTQGATYFVNPKTATDTGWLNRLKRIKRIENHVFYRDPKTKV